MRIAVTGASGFVGRHVLAELASSPVEIVAVTRCASRIGDFGPSVLVEEMDIDQAGTDIYDRLGCPDMLVHLAWDGLPNYTSLHHFETELPRQYHFLKSMILSGLSSLLVTGTCLEYGLQSGALSEELAPLPVNSYGYAKDALRRQLEFLRRVHPFSLIWARLFYMYGEGQSENSLLPQLKRAVARGDACFNMSSGEQLRDYLPVAEVARYLVTLALRQADAGIVNVCSGKPVSVRSLIEDRLRENGWTIELNLGHFPYPDYEPMAFWGNRAKLNRLLEIL